MEEKVEKKEVKKSKKKVIITVVVILVLILLVAGGFIFYHGNQTGKLIAEVNKLSEIQMTNADGTLVEEPIDMEIKTTGSYAVVEETFKNYMNEIVTDTQALVDALDQETLLSRIDDKDIGEYYKELYRQLATDEESGVSLKDAIDDLKTNEEEAVQALNDLESIFNFLSDNKAEWQIEDGQIVFITQSAYDEYINLMTSLETIE